MSGGSYNYLYRKVEDFADMMRGATGPAQEWRDRFEKHLRLVAEAMHDIEWVDSCDYGDGDELEAIKKVLGVP